MPAVEYFVIGDVQGCCLELDDLLRAAGYDRRRHRLAFVGDLINRGPDSRGVLERARAEGALVVLGNHEEAFLRGAQSESLDRVRAQLGPALADWERWLRALPTFLRLDDGGAGLILVHAGIAPGKRPEACTPTELTCIREVEGRPWFESWSGPETVIFGHWARRGKVDLPLVKGLDTGCVYGGELTGIFWPANRWVSVPARQRWFDPLTHQLYW